MTDDDANKPREKSRMSPNQAKLEAGRLFRAGKTHQEIADALKTAGYISQRGGPLSMHGVRVMLLRDGKRRRFPKQAGPVAAATREKAPRRADRTEAVRSILLLKGMDADEKIALALLLFGD